MARPSVLLLLSSVGSARTTSAEAMAAQTSTPVATSRRKPLAEHTLEGMDEERWGTRAYQSGINLPST